MRIAVVDAFSTAASLVRELRRRGVECVHVRSQEKAPLSFERTFAPLDFVERIPFDEDLARVAAALRSSDVDLVVAGTESGVLTADVLADALGLPGNGIGLSPSRRDKFLMGEALRTAGLSSIPSILVTDPEEAAAWFTDNGDEPVVVKPVSSAGTDNVRVCESAAHVRRACAAVLGAANYFGTPNASALIQRRVLGTEYIVNTVSLDGDTKVSDVWRSQKTIGPDGAPIYDVQDPQTQLDGTTGDVVSYAKRAAAALGIRHGPAHSEVMLTDTGPVLIECGARLTGSTLSEMSRRCSGISHLHLYALALTDASAFRAYDENAVIWSCLLRYVWLINRRAGTATPGWQNTFTSLPSFAGSYLPNDGSDFLACTRDVLTSPGFVALIADTADELDRDYHAIRSHESLQGYVAEPQAQADRGPTTREGSHGA